MILSSNISQNITGGESAFLRLFINKINNIKSINKFWIITFLIIFCVIITAYFQNIDFGRVYTHIFYVPIILACIWWQRKGVLVALFLSLALIFFHYLFRLETSILNDLLRSILFFVVAVFVSEISRMEKTKTYLLEEETEKVKKYLRKIDEKDLKLDTSFLGLAFKNQDIEKLQKQVAKKEQAIKKLKARINELEKTG